MIGASFSHFHNLLGKQLASYHLVFSTTLLGYFMSKTVRISMRGSSCCVFRTRYEVETWWNASSEPQARHAARYHKKYMHVSLYLTVYT